MSLKTQSVRLGADIAASAAVTLGPGIYPTVVEHLNADLPLPPDADMSDATNLVADAIADLMLWAADRGLNAPGCHARAMEYFATELADAELADER